MITSDWITIGAIVGVVIVVGLIGSYIRDKVIEEETEQIVRLGHKNDRDL